MQQASQRPAAPPVIVRLAAKERIGRIVLSVALVVLTLVWLHDMATSKKGQSFPDVIWSVIFALWLWPLPPPWGEFLRVDDAGVAWRLGLGLKGRASWADVTEIIEKYCEEWRRNGWGVALQTRAGEVFIPDRFTIKRSALVDMLMERWHAAIALAPRPGVNGQGHAR